MAAAIELDLLNVFVAVRDAGTFSGAAERLGVPKSNVSRSIARLEDSLGAPLFHRTTRRVSLSTAGSALADRISEPLAALKEAVVALPEREERPSGVLRLTAPHDMGASFVAEWSARFVERYPGVQVDARLTNRNVDLVAEGFDLALRAATKPLKDSSLVMKRLSVIEIGLFAAPSYLARRGAPRAVEDLSSHTWVGFRGWKSPQIPGALERAALIGDDFFFVREAVRAGAGIGAIPLFLTHADVASGALTRVIPRYREAGASFVLLYPRAKQLPRKVCAFRDLVIESLAQRAL